MKHIQQISRAQKQSCVATFNDMLYKAWATWEFLATHPPPADKAVQGSTIHSAVGLTRHERRGEHLALVERTVVEPAYRAARGVVDVLSESTPSAYWHGTGGHSSTVRRHVLRQM